MSNVPLSNILLPAVIVSSAVFSTLTLPFALIKSEPVIVEVLPFYSGEIQPIFDGKHKEVAIPYIGFTIVVSVGAGLACVEVNRRWQVYRESAKVQEQLPNLQNSLATQAEPEALKLPEYRPEASAINLATQADVFSSQSLTAPKGMPTAQPIAAQAPELVVDATQPALEQLNPATALGGAFETLNLSQVPHEDNSVQIEADRVSSQSVVQNVDSAFSNILESRHVYQTCRIKVPHLNRRLFAILVNDEYYSFFRAEKTREKILEIMGKLDPRVQKTVITKTEKGYVIWNWEPEVSAKVLS